MLKNGSKSEINKGLSEYFHIFRYLNEELNLERVFGLDVLRFLAITLVLISHSRVLLKQIIGEAQEYLKITGYIGVDLFFVLSGFLIGAILIKTFEKENHINFLGLKKFWKRRWFRTLPTYFLVLHLNLLVALIFDHSLENLLFYYFFSQNIVSVHPPFFPEAWSLSVEEWFYMITPFSFFIIDKLMWHNSVKNKILVGIIFVWSISFFSRVFLTLNVESSWLIWDRILRLMVPFRLDSIMMGVLFGWWNHYYGFKYQKLFMFAGSCYSLYLYISIIPTSECYLIFSIIPFILI